MTISLDTLKSVIEFLIALAALGSLYIALRKNGSEIKNLNADTRADNASAEKSAADTASVWLENYNKIFKLVQDRDGEIIELNRRLLQLEKKGQENDLELQEERELRKTAERQRDQLAKQVEGLQTTVAELQKQVALLQGRLESMPNHSPKPQQETIAS